MNRKISDRFVKNCKNAPRDVASCFLLPIKLGRLEQWRLAQLTLCRAPMYVATLQSELRVH